MKIKLHCGNVGWWFGVYWHTNYKLWGFYHIHHDGCPLRAMWIYRLSIEWWWERGR